MHESAHSYEAVIGLEVHAQLLTKSKAYSTDPHAYGGRPNTHVSPITLGHPGTLPIPNKRHFELAAMMGMAIGATLHQTTMFARKNYFYADLPKGYQITQDKTPLCTGGEVMIKDATGQDKPIGITRIHIEEDAGKSMHDIDPFNSLVDLNRAGIPLIEIVTEPDMRHPQEAYNYLIEIRKIVRYLEICDGNMEEGSLRCDANVSVRKKGSTRFGTKVEVKNMNSISNVKKAIEHEIERQIGLLESGKQVEADTRGFDAATGRTLSQRSKEAANDYRYFPEPDIPPVVLDDMFLEAVKLSMPPMHWDLHKRFTETYGLSEYDAAGIAAEKHFALYFEKLAALCPDRKAAANWMMGPIKGYLNETAIEIQDFPLDVNTLAEVIDLVGQGKLSFAVANQRLFPALLQEPQASPTLLAAKLNLIQERSDDYLLGLVRQVVANNPAKAQEYRAGKKGILGMFMGQIMKLSQGKADPKRTSQLLEEELDN
jgi:aspartyl-tRNA(Asn)/glutamyl-tRNA(Gln) amidotransferase subunit B